MESDATIPSVKMRAPTDGFLFTAILEFTPTDGGTLYRATARHSPPEDAAKHAEMGFHAGWEEALNQLVALFVTEP